MSFYFSLPRLLNRVTGRGSEFSEANSLEAHLGSLTIFSITYFLIVDLAKNELVGWRMLPIVLAAALGVFLFWIAALYLNSFLIRALHLAGFFQEIPNRRLQDFFTGMLITLFAAQLAITDSWMRWFGIAWLGFALLNAVAAATLRLLGRSNEAVATD